MTAWTVLTLVTLGVLWALILAFIAWMVRVVAEAEREDEAWHAQQAALRRATERARQQRLPNLN